MERQLLLPIADEIRDELLIREIVARVDANISQALTEHLPQVLPKFFADFAAEVATGPDAESSDEPATLIRWLREQHSRQGAERAKLSREYVALEDQLKELRKYAETIDLVVKSIRVDFAFLAQVMRRYLRGDYDEADWWKRGAAEDEDSEQDRSF